MKITQIRFFGAARAKVCRLGLAELFLEAIECVLATRVEIAAETECNLPAKIRETLDASFTARGEWKPSLFGGLDWVKRSCPVPAIITSLGVEIQIASRSGLVSDIARLIDALEKAGIDVGMLIVPTPALAAHLPEDPPSFSDATAILDEEFEDGTPVSLLVVGVEHDSVTSARVHLRPPPSSESRALDRFSWDEIVALRANTDLQRDRDSTQARAMWGKSVQPCPQCAQGTHDLSWVYFSSEPATWDNRCGREGWIVVCDQCRQQTDFLLALVD